MTALERITTQLDSLTDNDLIAFHKEVCRRAAKVYGPRYRVVQEANFKAAMACRDTRFVKGLAPLDNIWRSHSLKREKVSA